VRIIITKASGFHYDDEVNGEKGAPGTVVVSPFKLSVIAGDNSKVEIHELQPAGKRRMNAAEFLRGHPIREGDHFGPEQS
jgi:methionyl-tRNA formyltransferase